jgi:hypothetical protein
MQSDCPFCPILTKHELLNKFLQETSNIKSHENPSRASHTVADKQTHDKATGNSRLSQLCKRA